MNDINRCPNHELLVTYLYDECEPAERDTIAAHLALCASCAEDVQGLRDARVHLAAWSPPALPLGFQLTRTESEAPAKVLRPAAWWSRPLPAWAQAAAAVVIFAAGMSTGAMRTETGQSVAVTRAAAQVAAVSQNDLDQLSARLRSLETAQSQLVSLPRTSTGNVDERVLLDRVRTIVDERVSQSELDNIQLLAGVGHRLEGFRQEVSVRMDELETEQEDVRLAVSRGFGGYQVRNTSNGR